MNREEFMKQLELLLQNVSPTERAEALQYYNDYFDDAGAENEASVIEALGSPAKVAENIRRDIYSGGSENVLQRGIPENRAVVEYRQNSVQNAAQPQAKSAGLPTWAIVLLVIFGVLSSPFLLGIAGTVLGALVGIAAAWFSLIVAFGIAVGVLFLVMIVLIVVGVICLFVSPMVGIALIGGGLLCGGVGILCLMLTVALAGIVTPAIFKGIAVLWKTIFKKKEVAA